VAAGVAEDAERFARLFVDSGFFLDWYRTALRVIYRDVIGNYHAGIQHQEVAVASVPSRIDAAGSASRYFP